MLRQAQQPSQPQVIERMGGKGFWVSRKLSGYLSEGWNSGGMDARRHGHDILGTRKFILRYIPKAFGTLRMTRDFF
ncbi:MAG: hypothetical protein LCH54_01090 [Bacteroidetes bacterium]|nr:hypothetical protein [Bacteroidota bacterium]